MLFTERAGDKHVLTINMVSVSPPSPDGNSSGMTAKTEVFVFDHQPTDKEVEDAVRDYGFSPVIESVTPSRPDIAVRILTDGEPDVFEYSLHDHPKKFWEIFNLIPIKINEVPSSASIKGDWIYIYYIGRESNPPLQFFDRPCLGYSVRIHKTTGEVRRKSYHLGLALDGKAAPSLAGLERIQNIVATGIYLDEPIVTVYHMKSSAPEDYVSDPRDLKVPYYGTSWENGVMTRRREYMLGSLADLPPEEAPN